MAKAKRLKKHPKSKINTRLAFMMLTVLAVLAVGYFIQLKAKENRENQTYVMLEQVLEKFSQEVEKKLGPPSQKETKGYCARTGEKFSEGRLFCGVRTGGHYIVHSSEEALELFAKIEELFMNQTLFTDYHIDRTNSFPFARYLNGTLKINNSQMSCRASLAYEAATENDIGTYVGDPKPGAFSYLIRCTDYASKEHYPMGH